MTELIISDAHGIYIPQLFAREAPREYVEGVSDEDWSILQAGPDHPEYWEAWDCVLSNAVLTIPSSGRKARLYQDGDLWLVGKDEPFPDEM